MERGKRILLRDEVGTPFWRRLLWALVFPTRSQKVAATVPGVMLAALSVGMGVAAYNSANNILFVALSLLLGCLVLSGVLSWLNFRKLRWWLEVDAPMRAGKKCEASVRVANGKTRLPVHGLVLEVRNASEPAGRELVQRSRLEPGGEMRLGWTLTPARRGIERVELLFVGSLYPFGFLRKSLAGGVRCDAVVWPAPVEYRRYPVASWRRARPGHPLAREGQSGDLLALRDFRPGDSHRQIHWKASARLRHLVVRQFTADSGENFILWLEAPAEIWRSAEQFETLCSFAATLAEDLFRQGRLEAAAVGASGPVPVRGVRDLEAFLDRVALFTPETTAQRAPAPGGRKVLTFSPEGVKGVAAYVDGQRAASA